MLGLRDFNHEVLEKKEIFRKKEVKNSYVQDDEPKAPSIDTYMQIKKLNKVYVPMNMEYEELNDV